MKTDVGEYIVGAYLKLALGCDIVDYNVRPPGGGLEGLGELDVIGYDMSHKLVYLCEVTTHIQGLLIGRSYSETAMKIKDKHERQKQYASKRLRGFSVRYQFWSPRVPVGKLTKQLGKIDGLELIINDRYRECVEELKILAEKKKYDSGNPFFRMLQIVAAMRKVAT